MNVYRVDRTDRATYCEDYAFVVLANNEEEVWNVIVSRKYGDIGSNIRGESFEIDKQYLDFTKIDLDSKPREILSANIGA